MLDEIADAVPLAMVRCGVNELHVALAQIDSTTEPANDTVPPAPLNADEKESESPRVDPATTGTLETP